MEGVTAVNGGELIGINTNLGDAVSCSIYCRKTFASLVANCANMP